MWPKVLTLLCVSWGMVAWSLDYPGLVAEPAAKHNTAKVYQDAAKTYLDVPYLGEARDTVSWNGRRQKTWLEYKTRLNIYLPKGPGPHPTIIMVHGGAYIEGSKDPTPGGWFVSRKLDGIALALQRGYAVIGLNYILGKNIHPQVQRDFKECVRFLRSNTSRYNVNPNRIAAFGCSAGGWLITSAGLTTADHFGYQSKVTSVDIADMAQWADNQRLKQLQNGGKEWDTFGPTVLTPFDEIHPRYPDMSSRLTLLAFDFCHQTDNNSPDDPMLLTFVGLGGRQTNSYAEKLRWGKLGRFADIELSDPKTRGKITWHIPEPSQLVEGAQAGQKVTLFARTLDFCDVHVRGKQARTPAAEARPNMRVFTDSITVTFATASPDTLVHYTLDGSKPTLSSPQAKHGIRLQRTTTVKFISHVPGMQPSGEATATFVAGKSLPTISGPERLPLAKVGQNYSVQFSAKGAKRFAVSVQHRGWNKPSNDHKALAAKRAWLKNGWTQTIGLSFDGQTGLLHGVPNRVGTYVLQVAADHGQIGPGNYRTWTLVVVP